MFNFISDMEIRSKFQSGFSKNYLVRYLANNERLSKTDALRRVEIALLKMKWS